jgi:hypothetical protein
MAPVRIGLTRLIDQAGGNLFHAEDGLVELELFVVVLGMGCDMPYSGKHRKSPFRFGGLASLLG